MPQLIGTGLMTVIGAGASPLSGYPEWHTANNPGGKAPRQLVAPVLPARHSPRRTDAGSTAEPGKLVPVFTRPVEFRCGSAVLQGDLTSSEDSRAVVVFAHGTGSSRFSPRNRAVAARLQRQGLATLLLDLLTSEEEAVDRQSGQFRFVVYLVGERLISAAEWLEDRVANGLLSDVALGHVDKPGRDGHGPGRDGVGPGRDGLALGYFGASTGAAAAVLAACQQGHRVGAIVSRGGRPDLAQDALRMLVSPTLLIVGGHDEVVLELNRQAAGKISCEHELMVVPGASHLFEEPGALDLVAELAAGWFSKYLLRPA